MKSYNQKTRYLGIPVVGYGNTIIPEVELRKYQIIENMLLAGTQGVRNVVFDDGSYRLEKESDGMFLVSLSATGASPSAEGMANGIYFKAPPQVVWGGLAAGFQHFLYLTTSVKTYADHEEVRAVSSIHPLENGLLMASAELRGAGPVSLDTYPDGKVYSADVARHVSDWENPHGRKLRQDELVVTGRLVLSDEAVIDVGGKSVSGPGLLDAFYHVAGQKLKILDLSSPGPAGEVVRVEGVNGVSLVSVTRRAVGKLSGVLGEVGIGYHGDDPAVNLPEEFSVYNSGDEGVSIRAVALCT
jgi:hypothetical protein